MSIHTPIQADPIATFAQSVRDDSFTTTSALYADEEWQEAVQLLDDQAEGAEANLADMMARDKAFAEHRELAFAAERRGDFYTYREDDFTDWFAHNADFYKPAESYSVAGMVSL